LGLAAGLVTSVAFGVRSAQAQRASATLLPPNVDAIAPSFTSSLRIATPGPQAEPNGLSYRFVLTWSARPGAAGYRVLMWTDAARTWYKVSQTTTTSAEAHAFRSGCTAFVVVAVADMNARGSVLAGLDLTNVVRFPLSARPDLCPAQSE
jgi:hypothetical protein